MTCSVHQSRQLDKLFAILKLEDSHLICYLITQYLKEMDVNFTFYQHNHGLEADSQLKMLDVGADEKEKEDLMSGFPQRRINLTLKVTH